MIKNLINESFYKKKLNENSLLIIASLIIAIACVLISYPGILYSDSYARVTMADYMRNSINLLLSGRSDEIAIMPCWLTFAPSFFIAICRMLTGNIATYTMLQSFSFFLVSFLLVKKINAPFKWLQYLFLVINPLFFGESIYYEAGVGCATAIGAMALIIASYKAEKNILDEVIEFCLLAFASFVAFGYRANAYTILPVVIIYILFQKRDKIKKALSIGAVAAGILILAILPAALKLDTKGSGVAGLIWEVMVSINRLDEEEREEYLDYFDEITEEAGATEQALEQATGFSVLTIMTDRFGRGTLSADGVSEIVLKKYINFIIEQPEAYFTTKWNFIKQNLGINFELAYREYEYNAIERMGEWGFNDTNERLFFYRKYYAAVDFLAPIVLHPWTLFLVSIILVIYRWFKKEENRELCVFLLGLAIFYYGAFFINAQAFELRYFYPSFYLMWIMDIGILMDMIVKFVKKKIKIKK